jgi:cytidylate kinase
MTKIKKRNLVIAIDGPAASGKSTTARKVAQILNYLYIDTGAMYRALTLEVINRNISEKDEKEVVKVAKEAKIQLLTGEQGLKTILNGEDVSEKIRFPEVTRIISTISAYMEVREIMKLKQRKLALNDGVVMDGRDIGTVVLPGADIKIFMDASTDERTDRRVKELKEKKIAVDREDIKEEIIQRDFSDSTRDVAPLKPANDAIIIDTSNLTITDQVQRVINIVNEVLKTLPN